jgi:SAM-dependent methyltransferase
MNRAVNTSMRLFAESFDPPGPVIELGSFYPPGWEELADLRRYFPGREYIGCDIRPGLGVDRIEDAENLSFEDGTAGTVLICDMLPHTPHPDRVASEVLRILKPGGLLATSAAFHFRINGFPTDYYRFTASGLYTLLEGFDARRVFALGPRVLPRFAFAVAAKEPDDRYSASVRRFEERVHDAFRRTRFHAYVNELAASGRELLGCLLGRAELGAAFYDPESAGGYLDDALVRPGSAAPRDREEAEGRER